MGIISAEDDESGNMTRYRFFIPFEKFSGNEVRLPGGVRDQISKVLRLKPGDQVELLDNLGSAYLASLEKDGSGAFFGRILSKGEINTEPRFRLTLYFGLTQREKLEWILQKGTEIGVSIFQPFISRRTLVRKADTAEKRRERWQGILSEAAEQSGRGRIPELGDPLRIEDAIKQSHEENDLTLAACVNEKQSGLDEIILKLDKPPQTVGIFTGPEGGFAPEEIDLMREKGVRMFSLGRRVLRMETAAILVPALVLYTLGEMGAGSE